MAPTHTLWIHREHVGGGNWTPVKDGELCDLEETRDRIKLIPSGLMSRIKATAITVFGERPDKEN